MKFQSIFPNATVPADKHECRMEIKFRRKNKYHYHKCHNITSKCKDISMFHKIFHLIIKYNVSK